MNNLSSFIFDVNKEFICIMMACITQLACYILEGLCGMLSNIYLVFSYIYFFSRSNAL